MKAYLSSITLLITLLSLHATTSAYTLSDGTDSAEIQVKGVCGMCKKRIENAALINGVKMAEWDSETEILKVVYKPKKVTVKEIHEAVAEAGHRTDKVKADKKAYNDLPKCCQYDDGVQKH
jgi:copper chaperone CopZ